MMQQTPFGPQANPQRTFTVRVDFADGTFDVTEVDADTIAQAVAAAWTPDAERATVIGSFDRAPQRALAF